MAKSKFDALLEGMSSGGTAGFGDEIDGAIGGAQEAAQDSGSVMDFFDKVGSRYAKNRDASRRSREESATLHPGTYGVGEGLGTGLAAVGAAPLGAAGVGGKGALALGGALEGVGRSDDSGFLAGAKSGAQGAGTALLGGEALKYGLGAAGKGVSKFKALLEDLRGPKFSDAAVMIEEALPDVSRFDFLQPKSPGLTPIPKLKGGAVNATGEDIGRREVAKGKLAELLESFEPNLNSQPYHYDPDLTAVRSGVSGPPTQALPKLNKAELYASQAPGGKLDPSGFKPEKYTDDQIVRQAELAKQHGLMPPNTKGAMIADELIIPDGPDTNAASPGALRRKKQGK